MIDANKENYVICKNIIIKNMELLKFPLHLYNKLNYSNTLKIPRSNEFVIGFSILKKTKICIKGKNNIVVIKDMSKLYNSSIFIYGDNNTIIIGKQCYLNQAEFYIEDTNNSIIIGDKTSIHGATHLAAIENTNIEIGKDCMFSSDIHFRTGDSHSIIDTKGKRINPSESIIIGDHVWIGTKVTCLKGSRIQNNCVIGACSLVTKKFDESNCVLAGNPALIIRHDIDWLRKRI